MDIKQAIAASLGQADFLVQIYLADLKQDELIVRPVIGANPIAWQLGHLIAAERYVVDKLAPGKADALPAGFADAYGRGKPVSDNSADYKSKEEYLQLMKQVRANTLHVVEGLAPAAFDAAVGPGLPPMVKQVGDGFLFIGAHWLSHTGQWVVTRRKLGRPPLF